MHTDQVDNNPDELQARVRDYAVADLAIPDKAYFDAALLRAAKAGAKRQRRRHWMSGFASAVAAGFAVVVIMLSMDSPEAPDTRAAVAAVPSVTMTLEESRTVNLVFASTESLQDASLTVMLPDGIALRGFEGQREITWMTSLTEGRNVLPLTLVATSPVGGELLATLRHGADDRTFRIQLNVAEGPA